MFLLDQKYTHVKTLFAKQQDRFEDKLLQAEIEAEFLRKSHPTHSFEKDRILQITTPYKFKAIVEITGSR